ncbi:MAG: aminoglycoside phosphotransferase family protein [Syntrophobacteraceae bacterium]|nr:aminoglycoside phosphotransferase family protein [Syntrophobacteraceae bacterium]
MSNDGRGLRDSETLKTAAARFSSGHRILDVQPLGNGRINDTFLVSLEADEGHRFVLQRINSRVFRDPEGVMSNMRRVCDHSRRRLKQMGLGTDTRFELPRVITTEDGLDLWVDGSGSTWRAISFIEGSRSFDAVQDAEHAREIGWALGLFHAAVSDLPTETLVDTLPGFHVTPEVLMRYDAVLLTAWEPDSPELAHCRRFADARRSSAGVLEEARSQGRLRPRPIHGDPKVSNVMIDEATRRAVSIVDLDTVKPGLVHYDVGDLLRSCCNPMGGEAEDWEAVTFDSELCRAALQGYLEWAESFLTPHDVDCLFDAVRLIAFELGLRFLTDHLEGDVYFKASLHGQNLVRALVQFRLTESIELQEPVIREIIEELR